MKITILTILLGISLSQQVSACINSYVFELSPKIFNSAEERIEFYQKELKHFQVETEQPYDFREQNDYAVLLILTGQYQAAIQLLEKIEKNSPRLPKTAVNLGTAYELIGNYAQARKWIGIGIQRDPNIHEGSEWIHLNILNAKQHQANVAWLNQNPLFEINFGQGYFPQPSQSKTSILDIEKLELIKEQAVMQLSQRRQFVWKDDPIMAHAYYELANIEQSLSSQSWNGKLWKNTDALELIGFAEKMTLQKDQMVYKRLQMMQAGKFERVIMQIKDYFSNIQA